MDAVINFFKSIGSIFTSLIDLLWTFINDIVQIILMLAKFSSQLPGFVSWLPDPLPFILISTFTIVVIYKISGREG